MELLRRLGLLFEICLVVLGALFLMDISIQDTTAFEEAGTPIEQVSIKGPTTGSVNQVYEFTAIITPNNASPPIRYIWTPAPLEGQRRRIARYSWQEPGTYLISLVAYNRQNSKPATHSIVIAGPVIPINSVAITSTSLGILYKTDSFTATVSPTNATSPITYTWSPTPLYGQYSSTATFSWTKLGDTVVTVTASNAASTRVSTYHIVVVAVPVSGLEIGGPDEGTVGQSSVFTAAVSPADATQPITYTWSPPPTSGQNSARATYTWTTPGQVTVTLRAENIGGSRTASHHITIVPGPVRLEGVKIDALKECFTNEPCMVTAQVIPTNATQPVTLTWLPTPPGTQGNSVVYVWSTPGIKTITVTALNGFSTAIGVFTLTVRAKIMLPTLLRHWPLLPGIPVMDGISPLEPRRHDYAVTWSPRFDAKDYVLAEATNCVFMDGERIYTGTVPYYRVFDSPPSSYYYRVKARNQYGEGQWSQPKWVGVQWELDENTWLYQANGPLMSGVQYYGDSDPLTTEYPGAWDCFYIEVNGLGTINLELDLNKVLTGNASDGVQLLLYDFLGSKRNKCSVSSLQDGCTFSYSMTADDRTGQYFACVYSSEMATDFSYTLILDFPQTVYGCEKQ